ncbi:7-carboxy-7-deazaguanine synthase QueE [Thermodesulfobacteriota bacterium]
MDDLRLNISELFYSIQGESSRAGYPCVFIRLAGCNLRCVFCDARYTYEETGREISFSEILDFTKKHPAALVEITGGEPLLQDDVHVLMDRLLAENRTVLLETNGSIDIAQVPAGVTIIMDVKCPGSGMQEHLIEDNFKHLSPTDELKFVLSSQADYLWAVRTLKEKIPMDPEKGPLIIFSPVAGKLDPTELARWILSDQIPVRLQVQLHKILWPHENRGY